MIVKTIRLVVGIALIALVSGGIWLASRPQMADVGIPYAEPATDDTQLTVKWLGVATLLFDDGETQIITDGFVSRPSLLDLVLKNPIQPDLQAIEQAIGDHEIDRLAAVIPVHSHYDHAMDSADVARLTGAVVLGSETTANIARSSALDEARIKTVKAGQGYSYGRFTIRFYESRHAPLSTNGPISGAVTSPFKLPAPYTAWKEGVSYSVHISHPEGDALVHGSAGFLPNALSGVQADVVFLGSGGLLGLEREYVTTYVAETVHAVNPSKVYLIHHDNMFGKFGDVEQSRLLPSFDSRLAFDLLQLVLPASLEQLAFAVAVPVREKEE